MEETPVDTTPRSPFLLPFEWKLEPRHDPASLVSRSHSRLSMIDSDIDYLEMERGYRMIWDI